jgi:hypothetical protein
VTRADILVAWRVDTSRARRRSRQGSRNDRSTSIFLALQLTTASNGIYAKATLKFVVCARIPRLHDANAKGSERLWTDEGGRTILYFAAFDAFELDSFGFAGSPVFHMVYRRVDCPGGDNGDDAVDKRVGEASEP